MDAVIFGGGAAGLWLLDELTRAGVSTLLLEAGDLGSGQTIASQGIIHGGLKYTLGGLFTPSARAISQMPLLWRRCLAGEAKPNLSGTRLRAEFCHLWQTASLKSRLAMIGARAGLRVKPVKLDRNERPALLQQTPGMVARLDEQVLEPASLIADLSHQHSRRIIKIEVPHGLEMVRGESDDVELIRLINPDTGEPLDVRSGVVIFAAGEGNADLREMVGLPGQAMQRRPLQMVMIRRAENLPLFNGHCVDGASTRVTITSTRDYADRVVWQIGGHIAEIGVAMEPDQLIETAKSELRAVLPALNLSGIEWATYRVDRAEPATPGGSRPDEPYAARERNIITAWPTKLALVPEMVRLVMEQIQIPPDAATPKRGASKRDFDSGLEQLNNWPRPVLALPPWETHELWHIGS